MEKQSLTDIIRQRICRQTPRLTMSTRNVSHPSERNYNSSTEDVIVVNRFRHSNNLAASMTGAMDRRKLENSDDLLANAPKDLPVNEESNNDDSPTFQNRELNFCKACGNANCTILKENKKICRFCEAICLIKSDAELPQWSTDKFYHQQKQHDRPLRKNTTSSTTRNAKLQKQKRKTDKAICLTISSDEEAEEVCSESQNKSATRDEVNDASIAGPESYKIPKLSDRMKDKSGRTTPQQEETQASCTDATRDSQFDLPVSYVQFGSLPGRATTPLSLRDNILRVDIECSYRIEETKTTTEKYKLALSSVELDKIVIVCDKKPLMICASPTKLYADVVNAALSMCVLDSHSAIPAKRQMIFLIDEDPTLFSNIIGYHMEDLQKITKVYRTTNAIASELVSLMPKESGKESVTTRTYSLRNRASAAQIDDIETMFVYPPPPSNRGMAITTADLKCLDPGTYLNDTIIDFYLTYLVEEKLPNEIKEKTHVFNSYFYTKLTMKLPVIDKKISPAERMHLQVKKWTRNVDIFEKDFILIPVNEHAHWFLAIICFPHLAPHLKETECSTDTADNQFSEKEVLEMDCEEKVIKKQDASFEFKEIDMEESNMDSSPVIEIDKNAPENQTEFSQKKSSGKLDTISDAQISNDDKTNEANKKQPCILVFDSLISGGRSRLFTNLRQYLTIEWRERHGKDHPNRIFDKNNIPGSFPKIPLQTNDCDCGVFVLQFAESFFENPIMNFKAPIRKDDWFTKERIDKKRFQIKTIIEDMEKNYISNQK